MQLVRVKVQGWLGAARTAASQFWLLGLVVSVYWEVEGLRAERAVGRPQNQFRGVGVVVVVVVEEEERGTVCRVASYMLTFSAVTATRRTLRHLEGWSLL